jgi:hypothetical protein
MTPFLDTAEAVFKERVVEEILKLHREGVSGERLKNL